MHNIKISTAQFENISGDKTYNLSIIEKLSHEASKDGSNIIAFHECSITGYTFSRNLSKEQMIDLAEFIPDGGSIRKLTAISKEFDIAILAGLFEKDENDNLFNTYVCVNKDGLVAKHRKLHPFINQFLKAGDNYTVFELNGWTCGILICYDNNIIENVRATTLMGAKIIFMPHVTMCTPSTRPGAGFVDPMLWQNRKADPLSLRLQFDGQKGRDWLMKWLPARAYDNAIYAVFSNPVGMDGDQLKNGCSMIIDPFGEILAECRSFDDSVVTALITPEKNIQAGGHRYIKARRPELYQNIISHDHNSEQVVIWLNNENKS
jgi:predicted amidohydrolase